MRLVSFSVQNYRSITKAHNLRIMQAAVLIGPNNEGKSNILRALATSMKVVGYLGESTIIKGRVLYLGQLRKFYDWSRDYPVHLQQQSPEGESIFNLEFELTDEEINEFWNVVRSRLNGTLPIQITIGKKDPGFRVTKRGPGAVALSSKAQAIANFIGKRLDFEYIPAVRTAETAEEVVEEMVGRELSVVEQDPSYRQALEKVREIQQPVLDSISASINKTLKVGACLEQPGHFRLF